LTIPELTTGSTRRIGTLAGEQSTSGMITLVSDVGVRAALMPEMAVSSYTLTIPRPFAMAGGITSGIW
jgi:hypothetical protein